MPDRDPDEVRCQECGYEVPAATNKIKALRMEVAEAEYVTAQTEKDMRTLRVKVGRLQGEQDKKEKPPEHAAAVRLAVYHKELLMPRVRNVDKGPGFDKTLARLREKWTEEELQRAIWGYYCRPNMEYGKRLRATEGGTRKVELEFIMRHDDNVIKGIEIADREQFHDQALLNDGASRHVAAKCDCGHARADHALYRKHGHEACFDCGCEEYDDTQAQADRWLRDQGYFEKPRINGHSNGNGRVHA